MSKSENPVDLNALPVLSAQGLIDKLEQAYCAVIEGGLPLRTFPSVMLWGPPGVGKSQAVRQLANRIAARTGKRVAVTDARLALYNPIDLRGIPTTNDDKTLAVWLKPKIFDMEEDNGVVNILFLDELSAAPPSVQAAAYQITLDRVIGEHRLPENCIVIAAGNRTTDKSVAFKMPRALANRLMHIEVEPRFEAWRAWAVSHGVNAKVLGFLSFRQNLLVGDADLAGDLAFPTPRSWEMVSDVLNVVSDDVEEMQSLIAGLVGVPAAVEFRTWARMHEQLPSIEDIFQGRPVAVPQSTDALYALCSSMVAYAREHKDDLDLIANSIRYADGMPPDFSTVLMKDYLYIDEGYKRRLMTIPEFARWLTTKGQMLNGSL